MVAPLAGAWIEIVTPDGHDMPLNVAPLAGAWIEIIDDKPITELLDVAPLAGAWIEIRYQRHGKRKP